MPATRSRPPILTRDPSDPMKLHRSAASWVTGDGVRGPERIREIPLPSGAIIACGLVSLGLLAVGSWAVAAQVPGPVALGESSDCTACRIEAELIARIGDSDGPGMIQEQASIWLDARGRFIVTAPANRGVVQVFGHQGQLVHSFGRRGEGPGEFVMPRVAAESGDTIIIHDAPLGRLTFLDGDFRLLGTRRTLLPVPSPSWVRLEDGSFLPASIDAMRASGAFGQPFQRFSADGASMIEAFGSESRTVRMGEVLSLTRTLAPSREGGFWAAHERRYRIERWNKEFQLVMVLERDVSWFEPYTGAGPLAREEPPNPSVRGIQEDDTGLLWLLIGVPDEEWRPLPPARIHDGGMTTTSRGQYNKLFDTLIKVIDPDLGAVVTSLRIEPLSSRGFIGPGIIYTYAEDELGHPWYEIWRLSLVSASQGGTGT